MLTYNYYATQAAAIKLPTKKENFTQIDGSNFWYDPYEATIGDIFDGTTVRTSIHQSLTSIIFGDSNVGESPTQYNIFGNVITGISANCTEQRTVDNGIVKKISVTNNNQFTITIKEIAYFKGIPYKIYNGAQWQTTTVVLMFDRTVLATTVSIEPGQTKEINYKISFVMSTAKQEGYGNVVKTIGESHSMTEINPLSSCVTTSA